MKNLTKEDLTFFFLLLPSILTLFYILPLQLKELFILSKCNPTILSIYFSSFIHIDFKHFLGNLTGYLLIIFLILNIETKKERLYIFTIFSLLILPFLTSFSFLFLATSYVYTLGFSNIVSAFSSYLLYSLFTSLKKIQKDLSLSFYIYLITISILITIIAIFTSKSIFILSISYFILFSIFEFRELKNISKAVYKKLLKLKKESFTSAFFKITTAALAITLAIFSLPILIPLKANGINILSHYIGYLFGVVLAPLLDKLIFKKEKH
ncbi:MAG: hypothetical protein ACP5H3_01175 [Candidatus Aenigmatarchaeota archaeon]